MLVEYRISSGSYLSGLWSGSDINHLSFVGNTFGLQYGGRPDIHVSGSKNALW